MEEKNIYAKLAGIQAELKAPKNQRNNFGGYDYRSAEDILEAVKPLCTKYGTTVTLEDDIVMIGERYYVKATATLHDIDLMSKIECHANAREEESKKGMDASQVTGAASSYARKYALNGLFAIDDTKDSDATNDGSHGNQPAKKHVAIPKPIANFDPGENFYIAQGAPKPAPVQKTENQPKFPQAMEITTYEKAKDVDIPLKDGGTVKVGALSEDKLRALAISTDPALALQIQAARVIIREISKDAKPINIDDVF